MKKLMIVLIVLILIGAVNAKTIEKEVYEKGSVNVPGYNITILTIGGNQKSLASCINNEMKLAAAYAIAGCVAPIKDRILPYTLDRNVVPKVADAVKKAAVETGAVRK